MRCPIQTQEQAELLLAYCARRLDPETARALERHMEHCAECRRFGEQQRLVWEALESWEALPVSQDFDRRLYERIEQARRAGGGWASALLGWARASLRPSWSLAAASVLMLAMALLRSPAPPPTPEGDAEWVEVERVERALEDLEMLQALNLMARVNPTGPHRM